MTHPRQPHRKRQPIKDPQENVAFVGWIAIIVIAFLVVVCWRYLEGQHGGTCLKVETNGVTTESLGGKTGVGEGKTHVNALPLGSAHCESHASLSGGSASTAQGPQAGSNPAPSPNLVKTAPYGFAEPPTGWGKAFEDAHTDSQNRDRYDSGFLSIPKGYHFPNGGMFLVPDSISIPNKSEVMPLDHMPATGEYPNGPQQSRKFHPAATASGHPWPTRKADPFEELQEAGN